MSRRRGRVALGVGALLVGVVGAAAPVGAGMPGANGRIAFTRDLNTQTEIYSMNPDGSDVV
ncbi:MAG: hypothetical protein ACRDZU_13580, partial [Acidimicrobiales bacterium]